MLCGEHTVEIKAPVEHVWNAWESVESWKSWDPTVIESSIEGDLEEGAHGKLQPPEGPEVDFVVQGVAQNAFNVIAKLPLGHYLIFEHIVVDEGNGKCLVTHRAHLQGKCSWMFKKVIQKHVTGQLPNALENLKAQIEEG